MTETLDLLPASVAMNETSLSLLDGLQGESSEGSWRRLTELYTPLVRKWLMQRGLGGPDADDVCQEVLLVVVRKLPQFRREPRTGAFRRWLLNITINSLREFWRSKRLRSFPAGDESFQQTLHSLEDPNGALSRQWDVEHDRHVTHQLLESIKNSFEPKTWEAFRRVVLLGTPPSQAAAELGITTNAVFIAKSRVMTRLRQAGAGLLDE